MFDAPPLSSSYGSPQMVSDNGRTAPSGLERVVSHSRSGILSDSKSLGRLLSSDSAISLASGSPSCIQQEPLFRPSAVSLTAQTHNRRQHSKASGSGQTSGALQQLQPQARHTVARVPQLIDLDSDSPLPLRHRVQQPANNGLLRIGNPAIVDITGDSPPVQAPTRRFTNRIDLERIGSHTLASTSSCCTDPWAPQNTRQPARNRSQHTSSIRDDWDSAVDLVDMPFEYSPVGNVESQYRSNSSAANRSTRGQPSQPR